MRIWAALGVALLWPLVAGADSPWMLQPSGTTERLRGVAAVSDRIAWASGNHGTCVRTIDGGATWKTIPAAEAMGLDFRDVAAFDAERAFVLAIGPGQASRVFKATDHGTLLVECYRNQDPKGFLDAIAFWDHEHGLALGDPVDGRFVILATDDAGRSWTQLSDPGTMPPALPNEGAFAASGTCLIVGAGDQAWFATGGAATARVFHSVDRGRSWTVADAPIRAGMASAGVFGLAFHDRNRGSAVGGDYKQVANPAANFASTTDGGRTWTTAGSSRPSGFRSAVAYFPGPTGPALLTVGPAGTDLSRDGGRTWQTLEEKPEGWHALEIDPTGLTAWAVGEGGRVGRLAVADLVKGP